MTVLLLVRHGLTDSTGKRLTGWTPGIHLSARGREQADGLVARLDGIPLDAIYSSPLERCRETAAPLAAARGLRVSVRQDLGEVRFGDWTNRSLAQLSKTKLWRSVQHVPSLTRFPGGESFAEVQVRAMRELERIAADHPRRRVAVCSHADVIKLVLAHLAGIHTDLFQRLTIDTASVSVLSIGEGIPRLVKVNDTGDLSGLVPSASGRPSRAAKVRG